MANTNETLQGFASTGISMLDAILGGGLARNRVFLIQGTPGAGKTTLALQFLLAGAAAGEKTVYLTLSESRKELEAVSRAHGWSLERVVIKEVMPSLKSLQRESHYTMYHPSEVELGEVIKSLLSELDATQPDRVVIDALSDLRMLAENPLRYRRQVLALKQFFLTQQCTVLLLDDNVNGHDEHQVRSVVHGVLLLERWTPVYGGERRRLEITKIRGAKYQGGFHDYLIRRRRHRSLPAPGRGRHTRFPVFRARHAGQEQRIRPRYAAGRRAECRHEYLIHGAIRRWQVHGRRAICTRSGTTRRSSVGV